jgi:hypothetical protein
MRHGRQMFWLVLAGGLIAGSGATTTASLRLTHGGTTRYVHLGERVVTPPTIDAVPFDDDPPGGVALQSGGTRYVPCGVDRSHLAARAPVTTRNPPAPHRLKLPSPAGDDVPAH